MVVNRERVVSMAYANYPHWLTDQRDRTAKHDICARVMVMREPLSC